MQNVIEFILKYIWIFCAFLIALEFISVTYTASILMQQSALGVMSSVSGEVSGRVDGTLRLLNGLSTDERFSDTSKPLFDRITHAMPYQESYNPGMVVVIFTCWVKRIRLWLVMTKKFMERVFWNYLRIAIFEQ